MPFLRFQGFDKEVVERLAPGLAEQVAELAGISEAKVKIELLKAEPITDVPPSVEILMFPRKQDVHDAIAGGLHARLQECGYAHAHIFYVLLNPALYYKEGKPLTDYTYSTSALGRGLR
jgi:hypothetical protein